MERFIVTVLSFILLTTKTDFNSFLNPIPIINLAYYQHIHKHKTAPENLTINQLELNNAFSFSCFKIA